MNQELGAVMAQLPQYQCHKKVWALKIKNILKSFDDGKQIGVLVFEDDRYAPRQVTHEWLEAKEAVRGGYWVQYEGGYESFSPAKEFEDGYTLIK